MQESKHKFISARIMRAVAERQWKDKLPPVRTLAAMFSVSSRTVQKALQTVYASGMVIPHGARGNLICYKTEKRPGTGTVGIYANLAESNINADPLICHLVALVKEAGLHPFIANMPDNTFWEDEHFWRNVPVDGYIFANSSVRLPLAETLRMAGVPFVCANQLPPRVPGSWADFDHTPVLRSLLETLIRQEIRRVALYDKPSFSNSSGNLKKVWKSLMDEFHIPHRYRYDISAARGGSLAEHFDSWFSRELVPEAVILWNPRYSEEVLPYFYSRNMPLPLMIRKYSRKNQLASDEIITFRQNNDYKLLAEKVWGIFQMQLQTPEAGVRQILVPSALADVETLEEKIREKMSTLSQRQHYQEKRK